MVPIKQKPASRTNYGGKRTQKVEWIVMHYTANDGDSDEANGNYFANNKNLGASAHYFVDDDSVTASVPEECIAYHCGAKSYRHPTCRNENSIGVELCDNKKDGQIAPSEKTLQNAAELVHSLLKKYGLSTDRVIRHFDVTGKACPAYWVSGDGYADFKKRVEEVGEMVTTVDMIVDGKPVRCERILKNGTNYIKIRDVAKALNLDVGNKGNVPILTRKK